MGTLDRTGEEASYETRELTWELQQAHPDQQRIKLLLENGADLRAAIEAADLEEKDLLKKPALKPLQLQKRLHLKVTPLTS